MEISGKRSSTFLNPVSARTNWRCSDRAEALYVTIRPRKLQRAGRSRQWQFVRTVDSMTAFIGFLSDIQREEAPNERRCTPRSRFGRRDSPRQIRDANTPLTISCSRWPVPWKTRIIFDRSCPEIYEEIVGDFTELAIEAEICCRKFVDVSRG